MGIAVATPAVIAPAVAAGVSHAIALKSDGTVLAWGSGGSGQLGRDALSSGLPVPVVSEGALGWLGGIAAVAAGANHCIALGSDGTVWAWGSGRNGTLGNHRTSDSAQPVHVVGPDGSGVLSGVTAISAGGDFSLALRRDGSVWAWGYAGNGRLGNNNQASSSVPVQVVGVGGQGWLADVAAISAGPDHALALRRDGTVIAWGLGTSGELGNRAVSDSASPVLVTGPAGQGSMSGVIAVAAGGGYSLALRSDGTVWAWGVGGNGQLGNKGTTSAPAPVPVIGPAGTAPLGGIRAIAASPKHALALGRDGTVWAWGYGKNGELGNAGTLDSAIPVAVVGPGSAGSLGDIIGVAAGAGFSLALRSDSTVWAWGYGSHGQLGNHGTASRSAPSQVLDESGESWLYLKPVSRPASSSSAPVASMKFRRHQKLAAPK